MQLSPKRQDKNLRPVMLVGTGSDVGKSVIATALCRIFLQDGYRPAPFKAQNMSLNSYATPDGLEIGRAQAVQAEAAGIPCETDMNPLLLKPTGEKRSQVVLHGKPIGMQDASEYFRKEGRERFRREVHAAFDRIRHKYHPVVMEGAGSVSEINLREVDLVNMSMAMYAGAAVLLVADIERGGVFASVYGSVMLLTPEERSHVKGIIINKFRGDSQLFESGKKMLEALCGIPVVGIIPYFKDIYIEEEDSVSLYAKQQHAAEGKINIAVIRLQYLSNFTDFDLLEKTPGVHLYYSDKAADIKKADIILIPGSKNTLSDLVRLRQTGLARTILDAHRAGASVVGICGGYQMMGRGISDPCHVESDLEYVQGLGLLPVTTLMGSEKRTRQVKFSFLQGKETCTGYEIHKGTTTPDKDTPPAPVNLIDGGEADGYFAGPRCFGTYIHGLLDNPSVINYLLAPYQREETTVGYEGFKDTQYDNLAGLVRRHLDMELIYEMMGKED